MSKRVINLEDWHEWANRLERFKEEIWSLVNPGEIHDAVNGLLDDWDEWRPDEDEE